MRIGHVHDFGGKSDCRSKIILTQREADGRARLRAMELFSKPAIM
jgi:hypothetical protein